LITIDSLHEKFIIIFKSVQMSTIIYVGVG